MLPDISGYDVLSKLRAARVHSVGSVETRSATSRARARARDWPQPVFFYGVKNDVADLHQFVTTIVERRGKSLLLFAGSFGGHISLRYLHEHPKSFDFAVLVSPMLDIKTGTWPRWVARSLANLATTIGFGESYVPAVTR